MIITSKCMSFATNSEGGEYSHTLTTDEMPSHSHYINGYSNAFGTKYYYNLVGGSNTYGSKNTEATGGGQSHNNIQPYITVFFWRRTA